MHSMPCGNGYDCWLSSAGISSTVLRKLLGQYGSAEACYTAFLDHDKGFQSLITPRMSEKLRENGTAEKIARNEQILSSHQIRTVEITDGFFPGALADCDDPPAILFYQGDLSCLANRSVAVVGSRAASYAGLKAAHRVARDLSSYGIAVISGMAAGIDAAAHEGCMEGGSPTVAVTGSGLDIVYPSCHIALRDRILANGGLLLSEYPPGEKPAGWHFPVRNRIITGLSSALILMEARIRSGSMTSVRHALDQGRDVFVYPGDPSSEYFEGNHQLLREGGIYFTSASDIMEDLQWLDNQRAVMQNSDCSAAAVSSFTPEEASVMKALHPGTLHFEQLLDRTGLNPSALMGALTTLQIRGEIEALPGKQYQIRH